MSTRSPHPKIESFVKEALRAQTIAQAVRLTLAQTSRENPSLERPIQTFLLAGRSASELAREIDEEAFGDASELGGVNVYVLRAVKDGDEKYFASRVFTLKGAERDDTVGPSESATLIGLRSQEMRHNEMLLQITAKSSLDVIESWRDLVKDLRSEIAKERAESEKVFDARLKLMELVEKLTTDAAKRDLEAKAEARKDEAMQRLFGKLDLLTPLVMARLAGAKGTDLPGPHQEMFRMLSKSISKEQLAALSGVLTQEQQLLLMGLVADYLPPDPAEAANKAADADKDANGIGVKAGAPAGAAP